MSAIRRALGRLVDAALIAAIGLVGCGDNLRPLPQPDAPTAQIDSAAPDAVVDAAPDAPLCDVVDDSPCCHGPVAGQGPGCFRPEPGVCVELTCHYVVDSGCSVQPLEICGAL